ncbi:hypothetical protein DMA11_20595 [Marinilabiliaceae bacterium JC017]|nr:hypothetical protein DMA11_20595 [Marinilabiliaceae bacterium JC017]
MERSKYYLLIALLLPLFGHTSATKKMEIYQAYISNNLEKWRMTIDQMNLQKDKESDYLVELINYQYGYIAWCIGNNRKQEAEHYLEMAENNMAQLARANVYHSLLNAYKAAFYGFRIGLNKLKVPFLGPKSVDAVKLALEQDHDNWFAHIQYGNIQFYTPSIFGGSKTKALEHYLIAKEIMEKDLQLIANNWNYLNLLVTIGQAYDKTGQKELAKAIYDEILTIEPDFLWVKNKLIPNLDKTDKHSDMSIKYQDFCMTGVALFCQKIHKYYC